MTTIILDYKNQQIACDSRTTNNDIIVDSESIKYKTTNNKLWFLSGSPGDADTFIKHYDPLTGANPNLNIDAIFVIKKGECVGGVYMAIKNQSDIYKECILDHNFGIGSGGYWAISALDFGATAKEAVEYAMTKDVYSGGKVHVYDIKKGKFI